MALRFKSYITPRSPAEVRRPINECGHLFRHPHNLIFKNFARNTEIVRLLNQGMRPVKIGEKFGIGRTGVQRVQQRYRDNEAQLESVLDEYVSRPDQPLKKPKRFHPRNYLNSCPSKGCGGTMRLDWLPRDLIHVLYCLSCGYDITQNPSTVEWKLESA